MLSSNFFSIYFVTTNGGGTYPSVGIIQKKRVFFNKFSFIQEFVTTRNISILCDPIHPSYIVLFIQLSTALILSLVLTRCLNINFILHIDLKDSMFVQYRACLHIIADSGNRSNYDFKNIVFIRCIGHSSATQYLSVDNYWLVIN